MGVAKVLAIKQSLDTWTKGQREEKRDDRCQFTEEHSTTLCDMGSPCERKVRNDHQIFHSRVVGNILIRDTKVMEVMKMSSLDENNCYCFISIDACFSTFGARAELRQDDVGTVGGDMATRYHWRTKLYPRHTPQGVIEFLWNVGCVEVT